MVKDNLDWAGRNPQNLNFAPLGRIELNPKQKLAANQTQTKSKRLQNQTRDSTSRSRIPAWNPRIRAPHCGSRRPSTPEKIPPHGGIRRPSHHESSPTKRRPAGERTSSPFATSPAINRVQKSKARRGEKTSPRCRCRCRFPTSCCCFCFRC